MSSKELYRFLLDNTWHLTEKWVESLDKSDPSGVYSSTDPEVVEALKQQNYQFHVEFCKAFDEATTESQFYKDFEEWIMSIAADEEHLKTPIAFILREFFRVQDQYLNLVQEFINLHPNVYSYETISKWYRTIIKNFNLIVSWFTQEKQKRAELKLKSQQELINELSAPVISLSNELALLPLVGDIDTGRAKALIENTLRHCANRKFNHLLIDLSGVVMIDTMVAHQIFQLIKALKLIGVKSTLSGIRPEIAQTAIQLGIDFSSISVVSTLQRAIGDIYDVR